MRFDYTSSSGFGLSIFYNFRQFPDDFTGVYGRSEFVPTKNKYRQRG